VTAFFMRAGRNPSIYLMPGLRSSPPNKKRAEPIGSALLLSVFQEFSIRSLHLAPGNSSQSCQAGSEEEHSCWFGDGGAAAKLI
jgi:hypothetical protein